MVGELTETPREAPAARIMPGPVARGKSRVTETIRRAEQRIDRHPGSDPG